ncbi:putative transcriptional xre family [Diplodia seriata]|nr:putative transcriptional xre family [Diplodia seriata]
MAEQWPAYEKTIPHIVSLTTALRQANPPMKGSVDFAQLLYDAGMSMWDRSGTKDAIVLLQTAESILDQLDFDLNGRLRADVHCIFGLLNDNAGISQRAESLKRREKQLSIRQKYALSITSKNQTLPMDDDILLYNAKMDYACSLLQWTRFDEAAGIMEECLDRYKQWGPEDRIPFEYGKYYEHMAYVRMLQNRMPEALALSQHCIGLRTKWADRGPLTLRAHYTYATLLWHAGRRSEALGLQKQVLHDREDICGNFNEKTLLSHYTVGAWEHRLGKLAEAE